MDLGLGLGLLGCFVRWTRGSDSDIAEPFSHDLARTVDMSN